MRSSTADLDADGVEVVQDMDPGRHGYIKDVTWSLPSSVAHSSVWRGRTGGAVGRAIDAPGRERDVLVQIAKSAGAASSPGR